MAVLGHERFPVVGHDRRACLGRPKPQASLEAVQVRLVVNVQPLASRRSGAFGCGADHCWAKTAPSVRPVYDGVQ
jgi:hypothetical protein